MRKVHYITIVAAVALIAVLYFTVNTKPFPPEQDTPATTAANSGGTMPNAVVPASVDSIIATSRQALPEHAQTEVSATEQKLVSISDSVAMAPVFEELAKLWQEHEQPVVATYYYGLEAKLVNSEKKLNFAGQLFLSVMYNVTSPSVKAWAADNAIDLLERALKVNPDNDTTKMALASGYIDGSPQPMQGISLLRSITEDDPNNVAANMMLGQLSIRSGQLEKSVGRFETVLKVEPNNKEALYLLGNVYGKLGKKQEAVETLEKCKALVNNPQLIADIDNLINSYK